MKKNYALTVRSLTKFSSTQRLALSLFALSIASCNSPSDVAKQMSQELSVPVTIAPSADQDTCLSDLLTSFVNEYKAMDSGAQSLIKTTIQQKYPQGLSFLASQTIPTDSTGIYWEVDLGINNCEPGPDGDRCPYSQESSKVFWDQVVVAGAQPALQLTKSQSLTIQAQQYLGHATQSTLSLTSWSTDQAFTQSQNQLYSSLSNGAAVAAYRQSFPAGNQFTQFSDRTAPWVVCSDVVTLEDLIN